MIHLDTSFAVDFLREQARRKPGAATQFLAGHAGEPIGASVFVLCELEAGAARATHPDRERARVRSLVQALTISYPDERFAPTYGEMVARIRASGRTVSALDLLIATSALVDGAELVSANEKDFDAIPNLRLRSYR